MAKLTTDIKASIVGALACYESPSKVVEMVKQEFGVSVTLQQVSAYNPDNAMAKRLSDKWVVFFNFTRMRFQSEISGIPIANKAYRLRVLNRMASTTETIKNFGMTAQLLEQAAKEVGDAYTNKLKVESTGKDGGPIQTQTTSLTPQEAADVYKQMMG